MPQKYMKLMEMLISIGAQRSARKFTKSNSIEIVSIMCPKSNVGIRQDLMLSLVMTMFMNSTKEEKN